MQRGSDGRSRFRIGPLQIVDGLIAQHDTPAERIVAAIALNNNYVSVRIATLREERQVQPSRSRTNHQHPFDRRHSGLILSAGPQSSRNGGDCAGSPPDPDPPQKLFCVGRLTSRVLHPQTIKMRSNRSTTAAGEFRTRAARGMVVAVIGLLSVAISCRRSRVEAPSDSVPGAGVPPSAASDTVRGTLQRVGSDPLSVLVLTTSADNAVFAVRGAFLEQLNRAVGLEVMLRGTRSAARDYSASPRGAPVFEVAQFAVRRADGQVAVDGVLNLRDGKYFLVTTSGERKDIPFLPQALRGHVGGWVFLVGALEQAPSAYGILSERK